MANLTILLLVCHVTSLVLAILQPPINLKLISENFQHILTWDDPNNESVIFYKVDCIHYDKTTVNSKSCVNITSRRCDLTKDFTDVFSEYSAIVYSFTDQEVSRTVRTKPFFPLSHTSLGPALVDVRPCDHCIEVSIHPPISHLWSETNKTNVTMINDDIYPIVEYIIHFGHSEEDQHSKQVYDMENATVISKLLPNTNYCVSVDVKTSLNFAPSIPSAPKCVTTGPSRDHQTNVIPPVVCGILLFLGILLILFALDRAGYIGMRKKILPKMLKSLPRSESIYSGGNDCTSPSYTVPVEIVSQKLELEVNKSQGNEDKIQEGGYASRKKLLDSDTSAGDSSGPILSTNSSSLESSDQTTESSGEERIITEHPTSLDIITDSGGSFPSIPTNDFKATSDLPFSNSGVFNIDLNSICIANSVDTWTGLKNEDSLKEEPEKKTDTTSEQTGLSLNGDNFLCAPNVLVDLKPTTIEYGSDNYEEELSDYGDFCDSDDHIVSGYMRR